jgi:hypothetical protein
MKLQIQTQITNSLDSTLTLDVTQEIDDLAVVALDGLMRAMAVVELLDAASLAWLHARLVDADKAHPESGLRGVFSAMRDLVTSELGLDAEERAALPRTVRS